MTGLQDFYETSFVTDPFLGFKKLKHNVFL